MREKSPLKKKNAEAIPGRDFTDEAIPEPVPVVITGICMRGNPWVPDRIPPLIYHR